MWLKYFCFIAIFCHSNSLINNNKTQSISIEKQKIQLGKLLFFDANMSLNKTKSCSSCHDPKFAFTDGYKKSIGQDGFNTLHNAPTLQNVVEQKYLTWTDSSIKTLEKQILHPLFNNQPNELGWYGNEKIMLERLNNIYKKEVQNIYQKPNFSLQNIIECLVAFEKTLVSYNSAYDKYLSGNKNAINAAAQRGMKLFFSPQLNCSSCHQSKNLGAISIKDYYGSNEKDSIKYRVPSLRNVGITAPYTHNGGVTSLLQMINLYANGNYHSSKNKINNGFIISETDKINLIHFLETLTDYEFIKKYDK